MYGLQLKQKMQKKDIKKFKVMKKLFEKSIYAKRDIDIGEKITLDNISFLSLYLKFILLIIKKFSIKKLIES